MPLNKAMEHEFILDIERPFSLCDAIRVGFFDRHRNCFFHPTNGRRLNLDAACKENLIQSTKSIVKHGSVKHLSRVQANAEATRKFVSDVIAHQSDLRFITMAVQKFVDESMEYLVVLNYFRDRLPQRMRRIESSELLVQAEVVEVTEDYQVFNCLFVYLFLVFFFSRFDLNI
jgi:hypothetical protein